MCSNDCVKIYRNNWMKADYKRKNPIGKRRDIECKVCKSSFVIFGTKSNPKACSLECKEVMHKTRMRKWQINKKYGLSIFQYNQMLAKQNGKCAICSKNNSECLNGLHVDHNHRTNAVRDLLCRECNIGLGNFKEKFELLFKAIQYLKIHSKNNLKIMGGI